MKQLAIFLADVNFVVCFLALKGLVIVHGYTSKGRSSTIWFLTSFLNGGQLLKDKKAPVGTNSFFQELTLFRRLSSPKEANRN